MNSKQTILKGKIIIKKPSKSLDFEGLNLM